MMKAVALWFTIVLGYVIQTKGFSHIQSKRYPSNVQTPLHSNPNRDSYSNSTSAPTLHGRSNIPNATATTATGEPLNSHTLTVYLTFIYFASWLLILPISRIWNETTSSSTFSTVSSNDNEQLLPLSMNDPNGNSSSSLSLDDGDTNDATLGDKIKKEEEFRVLSPSTFKYVCKLFILSLLAVINVFTYNLALSLSPAFDVALIENTSIFEIVTLLYGVCNVSRKNYIFRNFFVMMIALIGILIVSYTKATCDLLAGKLSINQDTGEVTDPFLFDRLKGALICGLGALTIGPFAVLWNYWFATTTVTSPTSKSVKKATLTEQSSHLALIGCISMFLLLPFLPTLPSPNEYISLLYSDKSFWLTIMASVMFGILPNVIAMIELNNYAPPEYLTTCFLGIIIFMGLADWICEPTQTVIVRWEVIGYIMLSISCVILAFTLGEKPKKFAI
ncbi:mannosylinositol phosphorylceramide synthase regulatory subunit NDAI_0G01820 [Naumovozyma dairenensis CBS 421]|uniref:EamA domain-containing protein n=1 Tax=Naumovozyma dairenensis (strain ATCC 10597 / BCRC 20456 / CBS 421 / NBRC 0211 / NRRL Y-12639) TaxID=1071378 RepID=G0WDU7_NAUDC|nr:hypothetical protein NDAI_0G01820 [Naumovozyma dairenensis CBS 421]CCD25958.2 hypothetical protein NDAI_0G01820 [Naumovozyma dairenensis CBS 421]